jgi:hypothetical protein
MINMDSMFQGTGSSLFKDHGTTLILGKDNRPLNFRY